MIKLPTSLVAALGVVISLSAGCSDAVQPGPPVMELPVAPPAPPQVAPPFPALSRRGEIYNDTGDIYYQSSGYHGGRLASRYVLYQDSTFVLQFLSPYFGFFEYLGRYSHEDSMLTFHWDGWSTAGPWGATGTLHGDLLTVKYNIIMQLTDFVDGTYARVEATQ